MEHNNSITTPGVSSDWFRGLTSVSTITAMKTKKIKQIQDNNIGYVDKIEKANTR